MASKLRYPNLRESIETVVIAPSTILVGVSDRTVWVRVEGKGSFQNATGLKQFGKEMTNRGFRQFVFDLKQCPVMDSTFMGTLTSISIADYRFCADRHSAKSLAREIADRLRHDGNFT